MNSVDNLKIKNNELSYEYVSVYELYEEYKEKLEESNLLMKGFFYKKNVTLNGLFDDSVWAIFRPNNSSYRYIDFRELDNLDDINISNEQKLLIKCWIAQLMLDYKMDIDTDNDTSLYEVKTSVQTIDIYNEFLEILKESNNFSKEFLDLDKGDKLSYYLVSKTINCDYARNITLYSGILKYFVFSTHDKLIRDVDFSYEIYSTYLERLKTFIDDISKSKKILDEDEDKDDIHLPLSTDVLLLNYYINKFFNDKEIDEYTKMYYYPILIWWKITLIIPMRASEITSKVPRDCTFIENNSYYFRTGRSKHKKRKSKKNKVALPILTKFKITKEIYDLINYYIKNTEKYGKSRTLLSYRALIFFRECLAEKRPDIYFDNFTHHTNANVFNSGAKNKYDKDIFTREQLYNLLNSFYDKIVKTYYKDNRITERLTPNQTRHLAFSYLVLQEIPKVEIAILGGHSDTKTIDTYTYDNNVYIDSQVIVNVNKNFKNKAVSEDNLYEIVFSKPKECPIPKENCTETEFDGIYLGCCTATESNACESYDCYYCSHWYCEPTSESYITLLKIVKNQVEKHENTLVENVHFFNKILDNSAIFYSNDKELSLNKDYFQEMQQLSKKIKSDADEIIKLKTKLLENMLERNKEYTELEIIDKLILLNNTFNKDTVLMK